MSQQNISYWSTAVSLVTRTLPYIGVNAAVYAAFFVASLLWFGLFGGLAWVAGAVLKIPVLAYVFVIVGSLAFGGLIKWARRYLLYMVKGAHIAAMTELLKGGALPDGMGQFQYGRKVVEERFKDVSLLFALDRLVHGALRALQRKVLRIARWLPLPDAADSLVRLVTQIMARSLTYVDEAILSYAIYRGEDNVWNSARHGVLLYAQSYKPILITAAKIWLLGKVVGFVLFLVFLAPAALAAWAIGNPVVSIIAVVLALVAAWACKAALFEPFAMAYTLTTYHYEIVGVTPDPTWDERLRSASSKFRELVGKAEENSDGQIAFQPAPAPNPKGREAA
jgi:hypothetical protein